MLSSPRILAVTDALLGLVAFVVGWFAVGSALNVRRGNAALKWMQGGLKQVGDKATVKWIGTTAVELGLAAARAPFESATVVIFLSPRDLPWLWAFSRARGRRDTLLLRASLKKDPVHDLELLDVASWSGRDARRSMGDERWSTRDGAGGAGSLVTFYKVEGALPDAGALAEAAGRAGTVVRRLSVRRKGPHLQLHVDLPAASVDAAGFFAAFRSLGEIASRR
jgi:hypothetical protein